MGIETAGKAPESPFEKRIKINQDIMKLKKDLETVRAGSYSGKAELEAGILADIAVKEQELLALNNAPQEASKNAPVGLSNKRDTFAWDGGYASGSDRGGEANTFEESPDKKGTLGNPGEIHKW